jgi:hypothetical protein
VCSVSGTHEQAFVTICKLRWFEACKKLGIDLFLEVTDDYDGFESGNSHPILKRPEAVM